MTADRKPSALIPEEFRQHPPLRRGVVGTLTIACALLVVLAASSTLIHVRLAVRAVGTLEPAVLATVHSQVAAPVAAVWVSAGDTVAEGDPLLQLDSAEIRLELRRLESEIDAAVLAYQHRVEAESLSLRRHEAMQGVSDARLIRAKAQLRQFVTDHGLQWNADSLKSNHVAGVHVGLDMALADLLAAEAESRSALIETQLLASRRFEVQADQAKLSHIHSEARAVRERLRRLTVVSPISGVVLTGGVEQLLGSFVEQGQLLLEVGGTDGWLAVLSVDERDIQRVELRNTATVEVPALADYGRSRLGGRVVSVSTGPEPSSPSPASGRRAYRVEVAIASGRLSEDGPEGLRRGYSVRASIVTRSTSLLGLLWDVLVRH